MTSSYDADWRYTDSAMEERQKLLLSCIRKAGALQPRHYEFCDWCISNGAHKGFADTETEDDFDSQVSTLYLEWYYETQIHKESSEENNQRGSEASWSLHTGRCCVCFYGFAYDQDRKETQEGR